MTRRLLVGRAGAGKTHACLALLARALAERRRALLLVPTYGQAEHVRCLLLDRVGGLSARAVETFSSFAEAAAGVRLAALAHAAERDLWAERALAPDFPETARLPGFRAEFLAAVKEVKEIGLAPDDALARARAHFPEGSRGRRLFESFARYRSLARRMDHEDLLAAARDAVPALREPPEVLLVDGFHDFTGLELQILEALAARARETVVTLPLDPDARGAPVFATAERTAARLRDFRLDPLRGNRRAGPAPLRHMERALFGPPGARASAEGAVRLLACASDDDEADRLARLVLRSGRSYSDFLVVRRTFEGFSELYRAAFRRHKVPLRLFGSAPLAAPAVAPLLRALAGRLAPAELPSLLRSPLLLDAPPAEEVDALAAHLRERGAPEAWSAFPGAASLLERLEGARGPLSAALDAHLGVRDALARCPGGDEVLADAARALAVVRAEAEALSDLPLREAAARLLSRLPHLRAPAGDRRHDCVYAVEALDARQWEKPVVLVAGLGAQSFPRQVRQDLFLRDEERARFQEERGVALPPRRLREEEERYLFYVAMTRAREALVLSYAAYDEEGTPQPPSPYVEDVVARFDGLDARRVALSEQYVQGEDVVDREELFAIVADGVGRLATGRAPGEEAALAVALHDLGAASREELARPRRHALARRLPAPLPGVDPAARLSASGINDYLRCPYLFLARRVLRVRPARPLELDPALRGAIVHEALERFVLSGRTQDPGALFDALFAERTRPFRRTLRNEAHRRWMRAAVVRAAAAMRDLPIERVEVPFEVEVGGVVLNGRIDRVDAHPAGAIVRDYKTGNIDARAALEGRDVQLDVYLLAVKNPAGAVYERLRAGDAVGFVLAGAEDAVSGDVKVLAREELEARMRRTRETIARVAARARAGRLAVDPAEPERCTRDQCDAYDLCRVPRARFLERRAREREGRR